MGKLKVAVTALIFISSCIALAATQSVVSMLFKTYTASFPESFGARAPAFTSTALSLMPNSALICLGTLAASILLAALAISRANSQESKLYWVTVVGSLNYHVSVFLLSVALIGFFLLPKLANGT